MSRFVRFAAVLVGVSTLTACEPSDVIWWAFREHPEHVRAEAVEVAVCESRLDETARSRGGHVSWFQLSIVHEARANRLGFTWDRVSTEGVVNAIVAEDLYDEQGWRPWSCRP